MTDQFRKQALRVDAHQHFWTLARGDYSWMSPDLGPIYRDFAPGDLAPHLAAAGIEATVLVQAAATSAETRFMLDIADRTPFVRGVVGWIDFEDPTEINTLREFAAHPRFKGVRPMIQDIPDVDWMLQSRLDWAYQAVIDLDLTFDLLGHPKHLANAAVLLKRYPQMRVVIDHAMKPNIAEGAFADWADGVARLAEETNAFCKLSGLVTEAGADWTNERLAPYAEHIIKAFGPSRLMWGSDWPVLNLAADYPRWLTAAETLVRDCTEDAQAFNAIFGGTASHFYRLN